MAFNKSTELINLTVGPHLTFSQNTVAQLGIEFSGNDVRGFTGRGYVCLSASADFVIVNDMRSYV